MPERRDLSVITARWHQPERMDHENQISRGHDRGRDAALEGVGLCRRDVVPAHVRQMGRAVEARVVQLADSARYAEAMVLAGTLGSPGPEDTSAVVFSNG